MKIKDYNAQLRGMTLTDLGAELEKLEKERFGMQLNVRAGHAKNYALVEKLRKNIARVKTVTHRLSGKE